MGKDFPDILSSKLEPPEEEHKLFRTILTGEVTSAQLCSWNFVKAINTRLVLNIKALYGSTDEMSLISRFLRNSWLVSYEEFISRPPYCNNSLAISVQTLSKRVRVGGVGKNFYHDLPQNTISVTRNEKKVGANTRSC